MSESKSSPSAIVFSASLARRLSSHRLPPTFIGVRRVRPSSITVQSALKEYSSSLMASIELSIKSSRSAVVYKIFNEDGSERRMTQAEKKQAKLEAAKHQKEMRKRSKSTTQEACLKKDLRNHDRYFQLDVDSRMIEDEMADIKGLRDGVPPVALAPACARQAVLSGLLRDSSVQRLQVVFDDDLSRSWAKRLKVNMETADLIRSHENMRPMPYRLQPEVWTRMRPGWTSGDPKLAVTEIEVEDSSWRFGDLQPVRATARYNQTANAIVQLLYQTSTIEVSCGAKFGSDLLLYQGPREENHAFAGLRIECSESFDKLALPTAYDLSGYVRGLNTAAKLALIGTVVMDGDLHRIAMVDLALEKIMAPGAHKRAGPDLEKLQKKK